MEYRGGRCGIRERRVWGGRVWNMGKKGVEFQENVRLTNNKNSSAHAPKNYARSDHHCVRTPGKSTLVPSCATSYLNNISYEIE